MLESVETGDVNPEDRQIIEKLAKLQEMCDQIGGLRKLLPEKLINPTRFALENPGGYEPEKLAAYLHTAAQTGSKDVERFKREWHSEDVRQLWNIVNAAELPQGADAWVMDYSSLLQADSLNADHLEVTNGTGQQQEQQTDGSTPILITNFKARHPNLQVEVLDEITGIPVNVTIGQLKFQVDKPADGTTYKVIGRPNTEASALRNNILEDIKDSSSLFGLLETLAAYSDIKSRPCDKCQKLVNKKHQLPFVRKPAVSNSDQQTKYLALHRDCV